ncbi:unnamed protein product, partial [Adineta steineri]
MNIYGTYTHGIHRELDIFRCCIRQTIQKFHQFHTVATKPDDEQPPKVTDRRK